MKKQLCVCLLGAMSLQVAAAESSVVSQYNLHSVYVGAGIGGSAFTDGVYHENDDDFVDPKFDLESKGHALKIYTGINFNKIVGIELSYTDYGKLKAKSGSAHQGELSPSALAVVANVGYTFDSGFRAFALTGISSLDLQQSDNWFEDDRTAAFRYGIGAEYHSNLLDGISFRLAYEADVYSTELSGEYQSSNSDSTYLSQVGALYLGVGYDF
ncbi:MAG: porin family protein [Psychromonas sp.]|nr:porin family protein [Alteromonadales bacterium]MCP5079140.1 porin family protein [Psychromonas sp.]